ncbi:MULTISPECIES: maleylpyruvate isomerase family mycothiol-dependent enzyme [unclassified Gordonia (in: high G+C Gram-positive bacteria)]|uniref:maleylpyruvate isomerase family mycothiol-dependent enzyme n=1 Tax=unclassified Gordonia (in: high G+C Gram-positive bacteria) TaxID=2657482 RepID=UPI001F0E9F63|nr:maleylpyruvate isomerase family mycothiol-dependent enzyme [Gordonia sp. ABSL49_1]MCH5641872.1 maleylpyruvate isomerase family mycothiol-dependent enzyme [Gordonia sp. ABSL49_1]
MALVELSAAQRHRQVSERFGAVADSVSDWDAPSPVDGWAARDVVGHLVEWFPGFLAGGGVVLAPGPAVADDPVAAWVAHAAAVQDLLDGDRADEQFTHPMAGTHRLADAIDRFYTADVFMHTWDLAEAAGVDAALDPAFAQQLLDGMAGIEDMLRASGQYGPRVEVPDDADVVVRLAGFIGRDPGWREK